MTRGLLRGLLGITAALWLAGCEQGDTHHRIIISTVDESMVVLEDGHCIAVYPVSTSKYGLGDRFGSCDTPLGALKIKHKIGGGAPAGEVFKSRQPTGEIVAVDSPGRDPIVTRILWLQGLEGSNENAYDRHIYIHGTPEERNLGKPVSYGCIRMRSRDVIELYNTVGVGTHVLITNEPLTRRPTPVPEASHGGAPSAAPPQQYPTSL